MGLPDIDGKETELGRHRWTPVDLRVVRHALRGRVSSTSSGARTAGERFFDRDPRASLVAHLSDHELKALTWGGHDRRKVFEAYRAAVSYEGAPTVVLAKTVKGHALGPGIEPATPPTRSRRWTSNSWPGCATTWA